MKLHRFALQIKNLWSFLGQIEQFQKQVVEKAPLFQQPAEGVCKWSH